MSIWKDLFTIKKGDREPALNVTLVDAKGVAVNLTTSTSRKFLLDGVTLAGALVDVDLASGIVEYQWGAGDTDTAGIFKGEFEVTWPTEKPQTFPSDGYIKVRIFADLG